MEKVRTRMTRALLLVLAQTPCPDEDDIEIYEGKNEIENQIMKKCVQYAKNYVC
jgi:hypothetical protein